MFWNNAQAVNRAARTLSQAIREKTGEALKHSDTLDIIARLQGFPNHMAANAALEATTKGATSFEVKTWADLWQVIAAMSDEERKGSISISDGCDTNGNAEFFDATSLVKASDSSIAAASDGVLEDSDYVLLFNNESYIDPEERAPAPYYPDWQDDIPPGLSSEGFMNLAVAAERFANQCELMEVMTYKGARSEYLNSPDYWGSYVWTLGLEEISWKPGLGDYVIVLDGENGGYLCDGFGWTIGRETATGFDSEEEALSFMRNCMEYNMSGPKRQAQFKVKFAPGLAENYMRFED